VTASRVSGSTARTYALGLAAITLGALAIRLWRLDAAGVWFDEAYHVALVRLPDVWAMLDAILSNSPSDPLYALVLRGWVGIAGHADGVIRVPSLIVGTLTIPAAAWLARELDGRRAVGLLAATFVALSPYALEFSQEAAPYALAALATTLALAATWRWRRTGLARDGVVAVLLAIVAVYSHYVAAAVLGLVWLAGSLAWAGPSRVARGSWLLAPVGVLAAWVPWLIGLVSIGSRRLRRAPRCPRRRQWTSSSERWRNTSRALPPCSRAPGRCLSRASCWESRSSASAGARDATQTGVVSG
jgi:uncharacterized membrane protein